MVTYRSVVDSATCANTTCLTVNSVAFSFFLAILRTSQQFLLEQESRSTRLCCSEEGRFLAFTS